MLDDNYNTTAKVLYWFSKKIIPIINPMSPTLLTSMAFITSKLYLFVVLKYVFVNYCNKGSQVTQVGSHGIEASYITVHSYDILVINTHSWLHLRLV